jgi:RHS repeat-associated protein
MGYHGIGQAQRVSAGSRTFVNDQLGLRSESGSPATFFTRDEDGTILGERRDNQTYYFLTDGLGSVVAATDASGNVVRTFKYTPYGAVTDQTGTLYEPIRYASGYADSAASGGEQLVKFGERYYDPATGRWTQQDPIDNPFDLQGWNQYKYAGDDPINLTDLTGACIICSNPLGIVSTAKHVWHFVKKHENAISCGFFVAGVALGVSEIYVGTREAIAVGRAVRAGVRYSGHIARLGAVGTASGLSFFANIATGGCSAVGGL